MMSLTTVITFFLLAFGLLADPAWAAPLEERASSYWVSTITRQGKVPYAGTTNYTVFRDVTAYGAKGDGTTDDTAAINAAIADGERCGQGCASSTTVPAIVYFPPGTYLVSAPIVQLYYTQLVGDAVSKPTLLASASFEGMAVIDADPYDNNGNNYWVNQNNFFRQVRNFKIDLTTMPSSKGAGIHWQVAQATSLQNIDFVMSTDKSSANSQIGIFMDNGSGGFMSDLTFTGGKYGAFFGNQQFTTRNLTFNGCQTAVFMNWNWAWTLKDVTINNCNVGIDMSNGGSTSQTVGSVLVVDTTISNTGVGVKTAYDTSSTQTNGTLIMDNVDMSSGVPIAVQNNATGTTILTGNQKIASYVQGRTYSGVSTVGRAVQGVQSSANVTKPSVLLNGNGAVFTRSKPQYETYAASSFLSVKSAGAVGDGVADDTAAIQAVLEKANGTDNIVYFDHGAYLITDTIKVPANIKITGELWPMIVAGGNTSFQDQTNPKAMFQVGQAGESGAVELSDLIFTTAGPQPGAVLMEWNVAESSQGSAGLWDVHFRIGGAAGTQMELAQCAKNPNITNPVAGDCFGAFLMLHVTSQASGYFENMWAWAADHDLEPSANSQQIDIYNGRGVLIESAKGPVWLYGTASEHSVLYNYQVSHASAVYMALIQTETPYFQGNPEATTPFKTNAAYGDPDFSSCTSGSGCARAWGFRAVESTDVFVYGAGLYSFFDNYDQTCLQTESCQQNMVSLENSAVAFFGLSTKAAVNMLTVNNQSVALDSANRGVFCATLASFESAAAAA